MNTLTLKVPSSLEIALERMAEVAHLSKSEVARRAIAAYVGQSNSSAEFVSALDQAGDLVGCFEGGPKDLSSNPKYMDGFAKV